jgi:hypothetical protein
LKRLIYAALAVTLLFALLAGCRPKPAGPAADVGTSSGVEALHNGPETAALPAESFPSPPEPVQPSETLRLEDITFDDEERVRELIASYFSALEREDYEAAWRLLSARQREEYPLEQALADLGRRREHALCQCHQ